MKRTNLSFAVFLLLSVFILPILSLAKEDNDPHATGLVPFTPQEVQEIKKTWPKVKKVLPNQLGLKRINAQRRKKGLPELGQELLAPPGQEVITTIGEDALSAGTPVGGETLLGEILPGYVDNSTLPAFPLIRSQGAIGSCTNFAVTYYQLTHMVGLQKGWNNKTTDNTTKFSPKWTYNFVNGGADSGSSFSSVYNVIEKHGAVTWAEFPYDSNYRQWCLNTAAWRNAITYRTNHVQYISSLDTDAGLQQAKQLLNNGYILTFGTYINSWQYTTIKDDPLTADDDAFVGKYICYWLNGTSGSHAMTIVGYNDAIWTDINNNGMVDPGEKGALRIANSWGTGWGEAGYRWLAYDSIKSISAVAGAPSTSRRGSLQGNMAYLVTPRINYVPRLLAEFTINHAKRNQLVMNLGVSDISSVTPATRWTPAVMIYSGGPYAFDGTTLACNGTFVFDFSDILPSGSNLKRYYLGMYDGTAGDTATLSSYKLIDTSTSASASANNLPQTADASQIYAYINYAYYDGNYAPVVVASAVPVNGNAPLTVAFDGSNSYDSDGFVAAYQWNFGDGVSASGAALNHTFTKEGTFNTVLNVTDDKGATSSGTIQVYVNPDPSKINPPTNLAAALSLGQITLRWTDNSDNEEGFYIERATKSKGTLIYQRIGQVGANITAYSEGLPNGTYYYRVQAYNLSTGQISSYSNAVQVRVRNR